MKCSQCDEELIIFNNGQTEKFRYSIWRCPNCKIELVEILSINISKENWKVWNNLNLKGGLYD
jgi:hypothetical protein